MAGEREPLAGGLLGAGGAAPPTDGSRATRCAPGLVLGALCGRARPGMYGASD
jgi:hypothetical protein